MNEIYSYEESDVSLHKIQKGLERLNANKKG
jgi:hypothetical protein